MSHPMFDLTGRVAVVTGSSKGIGFALAAGLAQAGCRVVLNGRDHGRLEHARAALEQESAVPVYAIPFDAAAPDEVVAGVARIEETVGPIDVLVNNAGAQHRAPFTEFADSDWYRLLDTNLSSAFLVGREVARRMVPRGAGKIINILSVQAEVTRPGITPYAATKGALKMLTKGMCADLAPAGIQVNGLAPGYFQTELTAALVADAEFTDWVRRRTPAGRWGQVEDLVGTLLYLASAASSFVNGQVIFVDGGMTSVL